MPIFCRILCLTLVFVMLPGAAEAVENAVHLLEDGHLAHDAEHAARAHAKGAGHHDDAGEHGCTPTFHVCGCHAGAAAVVLGESLAVSPAQVREIDAPRAPDHETGHLIVQELLRPPRR